MDLLFLHFFHEFSAMCHVGESVLILIFELRSTMKSLSSLHREYAFTMNYFLELFDEAVGGELPENFVRPRDTPDRRAPGATTEGAS